MGENSKLTKKSYEKLIQGAKTIEKMDIYFLTNDIFYKHTGFYLSGSDSSSVGGFFDNGKYIDNIFKEPDKRFSLSLDYATKAYGENAVKNVVNDILQTEDSELFGIEGNQELSDMFLEGFNASSNNAFINNKTLTKSLCYSLLNLFPESDLIQVKLRKIVRENARKGFY